MPGALSRHYAIKVFHPVMTTIGERREKDSTVGVSKDFTGKLPLRTKTGTGTHETVGKGNEA
jgi:hypothetical protein